ncbi:MAG: hypothetical protein ABEK16_05865 [Candidatus Nanohalobium sp.]
MRAALGGYEEETLEEFAEIYGSDKPIQETALKARENAIEKTLSSETSHAADLLGEDDLE